VVSTNFSGMPYVVGEGGFLVPPRDAAGLADALSKIISDRSLASRLSQNGIQRVRELFTRDVVCDKIEDVYKSAVLRD
jgi:colanic acid/amylovoran biosynthesis glycosyltransferase